jgi:hypothetical protein
LKNAQNWQLENKMITLFKLEIEKWKQEKKIQILQFFQQQAWSMPFQYTPARAVSTRVCSQVSPTIEALARTETVRSRQVV